MIIVYAFCYKIAKLQYGWKLRVILCACFERIISYPGKESN